jgi:Cu/Ag efflux protein CusF
MFTRTTLIIPVISILMGYGAYELPALAAERPAHPEAMAVRDTPRSMTLSYRWSEKDSPQPVQMAQGMQHGHEGMKQNMGDMHGSAAAKPRGHAELFKGEGKVVAVVPGSQVVLDHKPIKGFMDDAMTMGYKVDPPSILEGLKAGDMVHFTIDGEKKAIVEIEKMK